MFCASGSFPQPPARGRIWGAVPLTAQSRKLAVGSTGGCAFTLCRRFKFDPLAKRSYARPRVDTAERFGRSPATTLQPGPPQGGRFFVPNHRTGGNWDERFGFREWQVSMSFGGYISARVVSYTSRFTDHAKSDPRAICSQRLEKRISTYASLPMATFRQPLFHLRLLLGVGRRRNAAGIGDAVQRPQSTACRPSIAGLPLSLDELSFQETAPARSRVGATGQGTTPLSR
jgi:hypothetical protein